MEAFYNLLHHFFYFLILALGVAHAREAIRDWVGDEMDCYTEDTPWIPQQHVPPGAPMRAHKTLPDGFVIANSTIPEAGLGVFATRFIPRYTWLAEYEGEVVTSKHDISDYAWVIWRGDKRYYYVDGREEETSNWLRYINCSRKESEENVLMLQCFDKPFYVTRKDVHPGQELLVYYGNGYARDLDINVDIYLET